MLREDILFKAERDDFMNNSQKSISTGTAIIITVAILLIIGWIISLFEPKCAMSGCKNEAAYGSQYCYLHEMSNRYYGNPDYNAVYKQSKEKQKANAAKSSQSDSSSSTNSSGSTSKSYNNKSSEAKSYSSDYYDDGYDDVYSDGEPDWDRYDEDDDYARGADDAMDDYEEYGKDW